MCTVSGVVAWNIQVPRLRRPAAVLCLFWGFRLKYWFFRVSAYDELARRVRTQMIHRFSADITQIRSAGGRRDTPTVIIVMIQNLSTSTILFL